MTTYLNGLATALPPHELPQDLVRQRAHVILGPRYPQFDRLLKTFESSGIERRWSVAPLDWFDDPHGWKARNDLYLTGATALFVEAAEAALAQAGWRGAEVDCIVTVSSTGVATPTLEALAGARMGFRENVMRVPVFGLGCAGGVSGLSLARDLAAARPGAKVLLVVVETCTLSFRSDRLQKADIIATVLFGDGAAAACLSSSPAAAGPAISLDPGVSRTWPDTLAIMGWDVDDSGLGVVFDRSIPVFADERLGEATATALAAASIDRAEIDRFVWHPGGARVVEAIEGALGLTPGVLDAERAVLRDAGNMSAPTALFVLKAVLEGGATGRMMVGALGPGFSAAFQPLRVAA